MNSKKERMVTTKKSEAKEIARDILQDAIGEAYYKLDTDKYSDDEQDLIMEYLAKEAERLVKLINREYITY